MEHLARTRHRVFAFLFDWAIVYAFSLLIAFKAIIMTIKTITNHSSEDIITLTLLCLLTGGVILIFICMYFLVIPLFTKGQTIGKKFFRIKIVKKDGSDVDFSTLFLREVIGKVLVDFIAIGITVLISGFVIALNENHQSFADVLASTKVVDVE